METAMLIYYWKRKMETTIFKGLGLLNPYYGEALKVPPNFGKPLNPKP